MPSSNPIECARCGKHFFAPACARRIYCGLKCYALARTRPLADRFWAKVNKTEGCWLWTCYTMGNGYGIFTISRHNQELAHRVSWELANGPIPEGMDVLHNCPDGDNPACVNPSHLWIGTAKDNTQDMIKKRRHAHGETHGQTDLTVADVLEIRRLRAETNLSLSAIGDKFKVNPTCVYKIVHRKRWTHV